MVKTAILHIEQFKRQYPTLASLEDRIREAADAIHTAARNGGTVMVCGNGGSAADSGHIVGELMKGYLLPRTPTVDDREKLRQTCDNWRHLADRLQRGIRAISLCEAAALGSAIANDQAADLVYSQQVYAFGRPNDVLIGLSTSGNSANVVHALQVARAFGLTTIGFTGERPSHIDQWCDVLIKVPARETPLIQEMHLPIYHTICAVVEEELFGESMP